MRNDDGSRCCTGGILQFSDFLGGPVGQGLGLVGPGPPASRQQVRDGLHVQEVDNVAPECRAQVTNETSTGCHTGVTVLTVPGHNCDKLDDVRNMGLNYGQVT